MQNRMGFPGIGQVVALALMIVAMLFVFGSPPERSASQALPGEYVLIDIVDRPLPKGIEPLEVYDAFVLAQVTPKTLETLAANTRVEPLPDRTVVSLNGWVFDTLQGEPPIEDTLRAAPDDPYFLIQFYGPVKNDWVSNLEAMGVTFLGYHPNYTYIVRMNPILLSKVRAAHAVQWVGHYHPAYRLASDTELQKAFTLDTQVVLDVYGFPSENPVELLTGLETLGIHIEWSTTEGQVVARVWATQTQLFALTTLRGVYRVEAYNPPELNNEIGAQVMNTWDVWRANRNGLLQDLMGQGQIAGMVDSGLDANTTTPKHSDYYQYDNGVKVTRIAAARAGAGCTGSCSCYGTAGDHLNSSGHGTHVAGSIVGNGYSSLLQQGLQAQARSNDPFFDYAWGVGQAPEAKIAFAYVAGRSGATQGTLCGIGNARTTWLDLYTQGARNVNNSWGNSTFAYGGSSLLADQTMWERQDYLIVTSAGNDGPGWATMGQPSNGKNLVTVGAAGNHRSTWGQSSDTANLLTDFSSRGPLNPSGNDYRFKPDVVAPGADILSTRSTFIPNTEIPLWMNEPGDGDADGVQDYLWSGGTSMSSPLVTGAATIIRQYLQDIKGLGNTTPPSAALIKAMLVNGAVDMGYGYEALTTAPYGGRNMQGWGMVNVENSIIPRAPRSFIYEDFTNITDVAKQSTIGLTASGRYVEYTINVVDASEPLKITLTWTDLQTGASAYAVNNLNLLVTAPGGTSYIGNMFSGSWSTTGGTADAKNNTEAVYLNNPATGTWTIRVTDQAHGSGTQPFALLISGGLGVNPAFGNRTCSWGSCPVTRSGSSSPPYFPSLKPLAGSDEQMPAGTSFTTAFQLTNWGVNADTLSLSYSVTDKSGNAVSGITVDFNPAGPVALASGASQNIEATLHASGNVGQGAYDVTLTATSSGTGNRKNAIVVGLNIIPHTSTFNETRVVLDTGPQFAPAFWGTGQTLWVAYLSAHSHNNSEAKIYAARSTDGGQTWININQVDGGNGRYILQPTIAGSTNGDSITVMWIEESTTPVNSSYPQYSYYVYARTWTAGGGWGAVIQLAAYLNNANYYVSDPAVIYDNDGHILAIWLYYDGATMELRSSFSTSNGSAWSTAAAVPDATGGTYRYESLTLDTRNNHIWMAYCPPASSGANRDVRAKYWNGNTNTWTAAGNTVAVATTADREVRPAITYIQGATAAQDALWIAWVRYPGWADVTPRLYYARSSGTLPAVTFPTAYGPYGTRIAEPLAPTITGDASGTAIAYLAYTDGLRSGNIYLLQAPAAGGAPTQLYQTATVDSGALNTRGNAGVPRLRWTTTTVNGISFTGPTLIYSKNAPDDEAPVYSDAGVTQTLFNFRENFNLYLTQARPTPRPITYADTQGRCAGNKPCYNTFQKAVDDVDSAGAVVVYPRAFNESLTINKNVTVNFVGEAGTTTTLNGLTLVNGTVNAPAGTLTLLGDLNQNGGVFNHSGGTVAFSGVVAQTLGGTVNTQFYNLSINNGSGVTLNPSVTIANQLTLVQGALAGTSPSLAPGATIERSGGSLVPCPD